MNTPTMSSSIILLIPPLLLLLLILQSIDAWTPRLSASHFNNSGGRFFPNAHGNTNTPLSLKATENNHHPEEEDTTANNNSNEEHNNKDDNKKKKEGTYLTAEYLSQLESLYASSSSSSSSSSSVAVVVDSASSSSSTYSLLESLTEDHTDTTMSLSTSSSPGQSLLYGEKIHTVVLGDWMEWEGEVEGGKNSYSSSSSSSSCFGENCGDDSEVRERVVLFFCL